MYLKWKRLIKTWVFPFLSGFIQQKLQNVEKEIDTGIIARNHAQTGHKPAVKTARQTVISLLFRTLL